MRLLFCSNSSFFVNIPLCGSAFICQQSRLNEMKLFKLRTIAFSYKVLCKFEDHVSRNDLIMMSLPNTMENNKKI